MLEDRIVLSPNLTFEYVKTFDGAPRYVTTDAPGNVYVVGTSEDTISSPWIEYPFNISKYSSEGTQLWSTRVDTSGQDNNIDNGPGHFNGGNRIAVDGDGNVYVIGTFAGTVTFGSTTLTTGPMGASFVLKLNSTGQVVKVIALDTDSLAPIRNTIEGIGVGPDGLLYVTGRFRGDATFGSITLSGGDGYTHAAFIAKLNQNLDFLGATRLGTGVELIRGFGIDGLGNIYVAGTFGSDWVRAEFGDTELFSRGVDIFVAKVDSTLTVLDAIGIGADSNEALVGMAVDNFGRLSIFGEARYGTLSVGAILLDKPFSGHSYLFVGRLDGDLSVLNARILGDTLDLGENGFANGNGSIAVDDLGNTYVTGGVFGAVDLGDATLTSTGLTDPFVIQMDGALHITDTVLMGGPGNQFGDSIAADKSGNVYLTGTFAAFPHADMVEFGPFVVDVEGEFSFLAKLASEQTLSDRVSRLNPGTFDGIGNDVSIRLSGAVAGQSVDIWIGQTLADLRLVHTFTNNSGAFDWELRCDIGDVGLAWAEYVAVGGTGNLRILSATALHPLLTDLVNVEYTPALPINLPASNSDPFRDVAKVFLFEDGAYHRIADAQLNTIDWNKPTLMFTHGWNSSFGNSPWSECGEIFLNGRTASDYNVIAIDWWDLGSALGSDPDGSSNSLIIGALADANKSATNGLFAANALGRKLVLAGIDPAQLMLIGHSNGAGFMASLATTLCLRTGVKTSLLAALDAPWATASYHSVVSAAPFVERIENYYVPPVQTVVPGLVFNLKFGFGRSMFSRVGNITNYELDGLTTDTELPFGSRNEFMHNKIPLRYLGTLSVAGLPRSWGLQAFISGASLWQNGGIWKETILQPGRFTLIESLSEHLANVQDTLNAVNKSIGQYIATTRQSIWDSAVQVETSSANWLKGVNSTLVSFVGSAAAQIPFIYGHAHSPVLSSVDVHIPANTDVLGLDLSVLDPGNGDTIMVSLGSEVVGQIDLATVAGSGAQHFEFWIGSFAGQTLTLSLYLPSETPSTAEYIISDIEFMTLNQPPAIQLISDQVIGRGQQLVFAVGATDPEDDAVVYQLEEGAPAGVMIDPVTGLFQWNPILIPDPGTYSVTVRATDDGPGMLYTLQTFTIQVNDVNQNPILDVVGGSTPEFIKGAAFLSILPQIIAGDPEADGLKGGTLQFSLDEVRTKKKHFDQLSLPSIGSIGSDLGETLSNGRTVRTIQLDSNVTNAGVQEFLRGIKFSTSGKGLKKATRQFQVVLTDSEGLSTAITQSIKVLRRQAR